MKNIQSLCHLDAVLLFRKEETMDFPTFPPGLQITK